MTEQFFTWGDLITYGGAVMAVLIITEFTKDLPGIRRIPTRLWAYLVALVLLVAAVFRRQTALLQRPFDVRDPRAQILFFCHAFASFPGIGRLVKNDGPAASFTAGPSARSRLV